MDTSLKYESWVACTIITNAAPRKSSRRRRRDATSSEGRTINAIAAGECKVSRFDKVETPWRSCCHLPNTQVHGPHFAVSIICKDNCPIHEESWHRLMVIGPRGELKLAFPLGPEGEG